MKAPAPTSPSGPRRLAPLAFLQLARPLNCLIAAVATFAGFLLADGTAGWPAGTAWTSALLAAAATALVTAAGNALNDAGDADLDRAAHPTRPIPSGRATPRAARLLAATLALAGIGAAAAAGGLPLAAFAAATVALLLLYEWRLKGWGLPGNVAVAALTAATLPFGALAAGRLPGTVWVAAGMAGLANLAREVAKDVEDLAADAGRRRTFPMQAGPRAAAGVACGLAVAAAALPFAAGLLPDILQERRLTAASQAGRALVAAVALVAGGGALTVWRAGRGQRVLRLGMAVAVLGFLLLGLAPDP